MKILLTEEVLLEALCFDFVVATPHAELVDLFDSRQEKPELEECAWSIASDSCVDLPGQLLRLWERSDAVCQVSDAAVYRVPCADYSSCMLHSCAAIPRRPQFTVARGTYLFSRTFRLPSDATVTQVAVSGIRSICYRLLQVQRGRTRVRSRSARPRTTLTTYSLTDGLASLPQRH